MSYVTPREVYEYEYFKAGKVEMVDYDEKVNACWWISHNVITEEQIEELRQGKVIYFDDGEYAHLIKLERQEENNELQKRR